MRVMVIVKATKNSEAGILPDFGENATPEVRERDARLRAEIGKQGNRGR